MKLIVIDNNSQEIIIYTIDEDGLEWNEEKDMCDLIEDKLSEYHKSSEISWMHIREEFEIKFKSI